MDYPHFLGGGAAAASPQNGECEMRNLEIQQSRRGWKVEDDRAYPSSLIWIYRGNTISAQTGLWSDKGFLSSIMPPSVTLEFADVLEKI